MTNTPKPCTFRAFVYYALACMFAAGAFYLRLI